MNRFALLVLGALCAGVAGCHKPAAPGREASVPTPAVSPAATIAPVADAPTATPVPDNFDACSLLTKEEVAEAQGSAVTDTKSSSRISEATSVGQCFYTTAEFSRSVSLTVTRAFPEAKSGRGPRDIWREAFGRFSTAEKTEEADHDGGKDAGGEPGEREHEKESKPPLRIEGVGEEAFWTSGVGSTLYVLKADAFIRIGIGSIAKDEDRLKQAKALAAKAIDRLQ